MSFVRGISDGSSHASRLLACAGVAMVVLLWRSPAPTHGSVPIALDAMAEGEDEAPLARVTAEPVFPGWYLLCENNSATITITNLDVVARVMMTTVDLWAWEESGIRCYPDPIADLGTFTDVVQPGQHVTHTVTVGWQPMAALAGETRRFEIKATTDVEGTDQIIRASGGQVEIEQPKVVVRNMTPGGVYVNRRVLMRWEFSGRPEVSLSGSKVTLTTPEGYTDVQTTPEQPAGPRPEEVLFIETVPRNDVLVFERYLTPRLGSRESPIIGTIEGPGFVQGYGSYILDVKECRGDWNLDGELTPSDIFAFNNSYFGGEERSDFNYDFARTPSDLFEFLNAYFAGCP